jgi:hypothetical protein
MGTISRQPNKNLAFNLILVWHVQFIDTIYIFWYEDNINIIIYLISYNSLDISKAKYMCNYYSYSIDVVIFKNWYMYTWL